MRPTLAFLALLLFAMPSQAEAQQAPPRPTQPPAASPPRAEAAAPSPRFWYTVTSIEGSYTVDMPGRAAERKLDIKGAGGRPVTSFLQEVHLDGNATYFGMVWTALASVPKDAAAAENMLMSVRNNTTAQLKGTLISTRPAKYGSHAGLDYVVEAPDNATRSRYRTFIVGNGMVQQVYSGRTGTENGPDVRKFHESLKLSQ